MRKILYSVLIGLMAVLTLSLVATAQISEEIKELQQAVGYKWQPVEMDTWNIDTLAYKKNPPIYNEPRNNDNTNR